MPTAAVSGIFKPLIPGQAVATLFLIENSKAMASAWPHLRDHHLPTLLAAMRIANPIVPIQIMLLTSNPPTENPSSVAPGPARQYYDLPDVRFNYNPYNRISPQTIDRGIQLLASTFQGMPTARHIVIVAASGPSESFITDHTMPNARTAWQVLAEKMAQENIHCHMILNPTQETKTFTKLFYQTLRLQNNDEIAPWFPADSQTYRFYLSARSSGQNPHYEDVGASTMHTTAPSTFDSPMQHSHTITLDTQTMSGIPQRESRQSEPQSEPSTPSLVSRLQKAHGLTKKKIYGTHPAPQPFFRSERVRDKYRQVPSSLTIPPPPHTLSRATGVRKDTTESSLADPASPLSPQGLSPADDGDRPFVFCPEYEAAAAARLQAVLKTSVSSPHMPSFTSSNTTSETTYSVEHAPKRDDRGIPYVYPSASLVPSSPVEIPCGLDQGYPPPAGFLQNTIQAPRTVSTITPPPYTGTFNNTSSLHGWSG